MCSSHALAAAGLALVVVFSTAACGLKGPLALPEKSERVIIRGPGEPAGAPGSTATDDSATGGATTGDSTTGDSPTTGDATAPAGTSTDKSAPVDERPPPPALPGGSNPGTARGG